MIVSALSPTGIDRNVNAAKFGSGVVRAENFVVNVSHHIFPFLKHFRPPLMALFGTARQAKGTRQALYPENLLLTTPLAAPKLKRRQQNKSNKKI